VVSGIPSPWAGAFPGIGSRRSRGAVDCTFERVGARLQANRRGKKQKPLAKGVLGESPKLDGRSGYWVGPALLTTAASVGCTTGFSAKKL
jgi:hypothetical protein